MRGRPRAPPPEAARVKAATRSRAFVSRAISVASEISRAEAASWWVKPARTTINSGSLSSKGSARTAAAMPISPVRGFAAGAFRVLVPCRLPIVEGQATNMSAMKSNELAKRAHARIVASRPVCVVSNARAHRFERSLPEQAIDKRRRRRMIEHEPVVSRERHPELAQVREVGQTVT